MNSKHHDKPGVPGDDCVLAWMKANLPPEQWTRKNYLTLAYLGDPPDEPLDAELEAELPEEFQSPEWKEEGEEPDK